jgi:hypothetical protein
MNLRQQIIQDRIERTVSTFGLSEDMAFLRFAHSLIVGQSIHAFEQADLVDGGQDKQIDTITIEQEDEEATIYILQVKNTLSFSSNMLIQMANGLDWIFNKPRTDINGLINVKFKDKIIEYRSIQSGIGPSNIHIVVSFVTNGNSSDISDEFKQERKSLLDRYDNGTFASFEFIALGADELVSRINSFEKKNKKINDSIRIKYDTNNPSLIKYHVEGLKGLVCTTTAREIARIVNNDVTGSVFDSNIRQFLGTKGAVNADILQTCSNTDNSYQFWFLNNGITIVCDSFDAITDPDNPHVKVKNMQIVNGCQTSTTLAIAEKKGVLASDTRVLLRIYEAPNSDLVGKIVLTTNNQNKISSRDLKANDPIQQDMERGFERYNYFYERKPRQYDNNTDINTTRVVANEVVAQCYLAIVLKKPSDARRRKYKVWGEYYNQIFGGSIIEPYILAVLIYKRVSTWLESSIHTHSSDTIVRKLANNGAFHVSRMSSQLWRKADFSRLDINLLRNQIGQVENSPCIIDVHIENAFNLLLELIQSDTQYASDVDAALKSGQLESDIDRTIYSEKKSSAIKVSPDVTQLPLLGKEPFQKKGV